MGELLEALLALFGLAVLVGMGLDRWTESDDETADAYRAGLDAAARISTMAYEANQAMHHAADQAQRAEGDR